MLEEFSFFQGSGKIILNEVNLLKFKSISELLACTKLVEKGWMRKKRRINQTKGRITEKCEDLIIEGIGKAKYQII